MSADPGAVRASAVILAGGDARRLGRDKALVEIGGRPLLVRVVDAAAPSADEILVVTADPTAHAAVLREHGWAPAVGDAADLREHSRAPLVGDAAPGGDGVGGGGGPTGAAGPAGAPRLRVLTDRRPGRGPLAGLEAGLGAARSEACLVLACDLPFLPPEVPARLLAALAGREGDPDRDADAGAPGDGAGPGPAAGSPGRPRAVVPVAEGRRQSLCAAVERRAGEAAAACLDEGRPSVSAWMDRLAVREIPLERLAAGHEDPSAARRWMLDVDTPEALEEARRLASAERR